MTNKNKKVIYNVVIIFGAVLLVAAAGLLFFNMRGIDIDTAKALSKEFSEKTKDALEALGKKPLPDDYLLKLMDANNKGKTSLVRKMLKGIPH